MQFHFQRNEGQQGIAGPLTCHDLHRPGSLSKFLVEPFNDVGGPQ